MQKCDYWRQYARVNTWATAPTAVVEIKAGKSGVPLHKTPLAARKTRQQASRATAGVTK